LSELLSGLEEASVEAFPEGSAVLPDNNLDLGLDELFLFFEVRLGSYLVGRTPVDQHHGLRTLGIYHTTGRIPNRRKDPHLNLADLAEVPDAVLDSTEELLAAVLSSGFEDLDSYDLVAFLVEGSSFEEVRLVGYLERKGCLEELLFDNLLEDFPCFLAEGNFLLEEELDP
jgi:hypothetical protein